MPDRYTQSMRITTVIIVYFALTALWTAIASNLQTRHDVVNTQLQNDVANLWGREHVQGLPYLAGKNVLDTASIQAKLDLQYRKKGHYWYSTYTSHFSGTFSFAPAPQADVLVFPLPVGNGMFTDFQVQVDGKPSSYTTATEHVQIDIPKGSASVTVTYVGQGSNEWWLRFEEKVGSTKDLHVEVVTNFQDFDFPDGSVSPAQRLDKGGGSTLVWDYHNLLSGAKIGIVLPKRANSGPVLIDICRYAPLGLFLFFAALTVCSLAEARLPHPVHYVLLGASFFAFHLLLVYLGDVLPLSIAFTTAAALSIAISVSYARKAFDPLFAVRRLLPAQALYLVGYSSAFLVEGFKGLPIVLILVLSLHLAMQVVSRVDWEQFERAREG